MSKAIDSLTTQTASADTFEVVLVNDGFDSATAEICRAALTRFQGTYIEHHDNRGLASAKNSGIGAARGKYVLFMNDDTYAAPVLVEEILATFTRLDGKRAGVLGSITWTDDLKRKVFYRVMEQKNFYTPYIGLEEDTPYPFEYFIGTNTAFPREAFLRNNQWFDETFYKYGAEDIELGYRLSRLGYSIYYNPRALMVHDHPMTVRDFRRRAEENAANVIQLLSKHPELLPKYLGTDRITTQLVDGMRAQIVQDAAAAESLTVQLETVVETDVESSNLPLRPEHQTLAESIGDGLCELLYFETIRSYVDTLERYPEFRQVLEMGGGDGG